jgi:hypothetical protein
LETLLSKVLGGVGTLFQKGSDPPEAKVIEDLGGLDFIFRKF